MTTNIKPSKSTSLFAAACLWGAAAGASLAQDEAYGPSADEGREDSYSIILNQDSFFGFYPSFNGLVPISDNVDFSFYGILWTKPSFGLNPTNTGDDLWTEFGVGANFLFLDGDLAVKPQIGLTNGALLSGGDIDENGNVTGANFADGFVPSLTANYSGVRQRDGDAALDFFHTWLNAGFKFSDYVSAGAHYEILQTARNTYPGGATGLAYQWIGGYTQFSLPKGFFARFTAGTDISDNGQGDFYKLGTGFSF